MALKILQYNIQSLNKTENKNLLELFLETEQMDIAFLLKPGSDMTLQPIFVITIFMVEKGKMATVVKVSTLSAYMKFSTLSAYINIKNPFNIVVAYIPPNTNPFNYIDIVSNIFQTINTLKHPTSLVGDHLSVTILIRQVTYLPDLLMSIIFHA